MPVIVVVNLADSRRPTVAVPLDVDVGVEMNVKVGTVEILEQNWLRMGTALRAKREEKDMQKGMMSHSILTVFRARPYSDSNWQGRILLQEMFRQPLNLFLVRRFFHPNKEVSSR